MAGVQGRALLILGRTKGLAKLSLLVLDSLAVIVKRSDFRQRWEGQVGVEMDQVTGALGRAVSSYVFVGKT